MPAYEQAFGVVRPGGMISRVGVPQYEDGARSASAACSAATSPSPADPHRPARTSRSSCPTSSTARIEPGKVFDRTVDLDGVPDGYRAMADREALKVLVKP